MMSGNQPAGTSRELLIWTPCWPGRSTHPSRTHGWLHQCRRHVHPGANRGLWATCGPVTSFSRPFTIGTLIGQKKVQTPFA